LGHNHNFSKHSFDPATLRVLYAAFDRAWKVVEAETVVSNRNAARETMALALIGLGHFGETDVERLTAHAVARVRRDLLPPPQAA
jgi:uncharacterized protein (DUF1800 family)